MYVKLMSLICMIAISVHKFCQMEALSPAVATGEKFRVRVRVRIKVRVMVN